MAVELVGYSCILQVAARVPAGGKGVEEGGRWVSDTVIVIVFLLIILVWIKLAL